jgi:hypothetical protein
MKPMIKGKSAPWISPCKKSPWDITLSTPGKIGYLNSFLIPWINVFFKGRKFSYRVDKPIYDRHAIEYALRDFNYDARKKFTIKFHVPEFMVIDAEINVLGEEIISCPLGDIACWKVEMVPKVLFFKWRFYFWIEKDYSKRFVKYSDSSGKNSILLIDYARVD